jgi:hypothetical protein
LIRQEAAIQKRLQEIGAALDAIGAQGRAVQATGEYAFRAAIQPFIKAARESVADALERFCTSRAWAMQTAEKIPYLEMFHGFATLPWGRSATEGSVRTLLGHLEKLLSGECPFVFAREEPLPPTACLRIVGDQARTLTAEETEQFAEHQASLKQVCS